MKYINQKTYVFVHYFKEYIEYLNMFISLTISLIYLLKELSYYSFIKGVGGLPFSKFIYCGFYYILICLPFIYSFFYEL